MAVLILLTLCAKHFITQLELSSRVIGLSTLYTVIGETYDAHSALSGLPLQSGFSLYRDRQSEQLQPLFIISHSSTYSALQHFRSVVVIAVTHDLLLAEHQWVSYRFNVKIRANYECTTKAAIKMLNLLAKCKLCKLLCMHAMCVNLDT